MLESSKEKRERYANTHIFAGIFKGQIVNSYNKGLYHHSSLIYPAFVVD